MVQKKTRGNGNICLISQDNTDNPKLKAKILADGRASLFLEYYLGYVKTYDEEKGKEVIRKSRKVEYIKLYIWQAPRTPEERQQNKETLEVAKRLRFERGQQLLENKEGYRLWKDKDINFHDWALSYWEGYTKSDKGKIRMARLVFIDFLKSTPKYQRFASRITPNQITKPMMQDFTDYLQGRYNGEGGHTMYSRFKKIVKNAVENDVMMKNPCTGVSIKIDQGQLKKDVLSIDEVKQLIATHYEGESPNIRRAFIFCLSCGLRWCDVKDLTFGNVDYSNRVLKFEQNKTKGHSAASGVVIPLNEGLLSLIGKPASPEDEDALIFPLPSHTMALKALRHWTKRAGITKHITWHCARHSFATNALSNGANIKTVASLLGHSGLRHTEKYTRAVDSLKQAAIDSLNFLPTNGAY